MLELRNVCKTFSASTPDEKRALTDVSLKIEDGDFVSIIGANGAGKSTLFNAICGSFPLDSGTVWLDGKNVTMMPEHQRAKQIGRLFQDPMRGSAPDMSIEENLTLAAGKGGWLSRISAADRNAFRDRPALRRTAAGADTADGDIPGAEGAAAGRAYGSAGSGDGGKGTGND